MTTLPWFLVKKQNVKLQMIKRRFEFTMMNMGTHIWIFLG